MNAFLDCAWPGQPPTKGLPLPDSKKSPQERQKSLCSGCSPFPPHPCKSSQPPTSQVHSASLTRSSASPTGGLGRMVLSDPLSPHTQGGACPGLTDKSDTSEYPGHTSSAWPWPPGSERSLFPRAGSSCPELSRDWSRQRQWASAFPLPPLQPAGSLPPRALEGSELGLF